MKKALLILSGGMDSVTMLYQYKEFIKLAITFDYGANMSKNEIQCAAYHCRKLGIKHIIVPLPFIKDYFSSSLISGGDNIPDVTTDNSNASSVVVPFRNGIMLSVACGIANSNGLDTVLVATQTGDISACAFPDCSSQFIRAINDAVCLGTGGAVCVRAPYGDLKKSEIIKIGLQCGVDYGKTYSCYRGGNKHCGVCGTCIKRKQGFAELGLKDSVIYEQ